MPKGRQLVGPVYGYLRCLRRTNVFVCLQHRRRLFPTLNGKWILNVESGARPVFEGILTLLAIRESRLMSNIRRLAFNLIIDKVEEESSFTKLPRDISISAQIQIVLRWRSSALFCPHTTNVSFYITISNWHDMIIQKT